MKKKLFVSLMALILVFSWASAASLTAFADDTVEVLLPEEVDVVGNVPTEKNVYKLVIEAEESGNPMPEGSVDGVFVLVLNGPSDSFFPEIIFDHVGIYNYTVYQLKGNDSECIYDDTVYDLKITVVNSDSGDGLEANVAVTNEDTSAKVAEVEFVNKYVYPPTDTPRTGDSAMLSSYGALSLLSLLGIAAVLSLPARKKQL